MLNPSTITDAIAATLKAIPALAAAMTVDSVVRIDAFHYRLGDEFRLTEAIYKMAAPSMLIAWEGTQGGNFDGATIWKHKFGVYYRMGNAAGVDDPLGYEDLFWLTCNSIPTGNSVNIRYISFVSGVDIMDTPSVIHSVDEDGIDIFKAVFVVPEIGDN